VIKTRLTAGIYYRRKIEQVKVSERFARAISANVSSERITL
jgi:hypothetical protein